MAQLEFYFDFRSPYSYLALSQLDSLAVELRLIPIDVLEVMKVVGNTPTTMICGVKRRYAGADLGRWAQRYGVPIAPHPQLVSLDGVALLRVALAGEALGFGRKTIDALFDAVWRDSADLSAAGLKALLAKAGLPAQEILARAETPQIAEALAANSQSAADRGVFGAPTFFVGDEIFFGNDRLDFVRDHLAAQTREA